MSRHPMANWTLISIAISTRAAVSSETLLGIIELLNDG